MSYDIFRGGIGRGLQAAPDLKHEDHFRHA